MRKAIFALGFVALLLAIPALNLIVSRPTGTTLTTYARGNPHAEAAAAILEKSCSNCHTTQGDLPPYARLPFVGRLVRHDIEHALAALDLEASLRPGVSLPPGEATLAKLEHALGTGRMPPGRYRAMHWNAHLHPAQETAIATWIASLRADHYAAPGLSPEVASRAIQPLPYSVDVDAAKAALGEQLYHDVRLSGDQTISCASCHDLARGGADGERTSRGIGRQRGTVNAPTTFNAAFQSAQFWDGRAETLDEQAAGPPVNPVEMGSTWPAIVRELGRDAEFARAFRRVYPQGLCEENLTDAIAEYERTLITPRSRFDGFLRGDVNALTPTERRGWEIFQAQGCQTCHVGKLLGGQSFEVMGRRADYFANRKPSKADAGRFNVTGAAADMHRFKVPTLRNVALTAPYFHDGTSEDLESAVREMGRYQLGVELSEPDVKALVEFLGTLTGEQPRRSG